ncbi:potassium-transporting ATPase subunit KdpC [Actinacidiphila bryophytorum]|uniref:potassium-transporting ATPase subunit KdpC n=1 Tax=Actinacidiphila bryophytorum TaxID=1436133 RepID=UPI002176AF2D|nr:potassium-transporting ATPase subunit KdpC [Actinacidiphila bryophytorum]UWE07407.1 potassium-transporting ATPase subunit KdpC [Actinacidiphila bryophytorum]
MASYLPPAVRRHLSALRMLLVLTVITGVLYPLAVTGVAQAAFHHQANGSVVTQNGMSVGSSLLGQSFDLPKKNPNNPDEAARPDPKFFQPRPSAGSYDPLASGASNLGPNNPDLVKAINDRRAAVAAFDGVSPKDVPADALTASGSGLDPDISTAYAYEQVNRVATARGLSPQQVHTLVAHHVHGRDLGFLGEPRVNVLDLNRALNALSR